MGMCVNESGHDYFAGNVVDISVIWDICIGIAHGYNFAILNDEYSIVDWLAGDWDDIGSCK